MISVLDLHKKFGDTEVLSGISVEINKGDVVCVIGPSGSGKSTFLRCLNVLEKPSSGKIIFEGNDLTDKKVNLNLHRQKMGMVFQHFNLFPHMTILDNMTVAPMMLRHIPREEAESKGMEMLGRVGLADRADAYPSQLSGGQKQRVAIAGVIAMQPRIIVLDEPTAMLDPQGRAEVIGTITKLCRENGMTVVLITHHMDECVGADRLIVMSNGHIVADGTPKDVFADVALMDREGLSVPATVRLMHELRDAGWALPEDELDVEDCADELADFIKRKENG